MDMKRLEEMMISELHLSLEEARVYLTLLNKRSSKDAFDINNIDFVLSTLVEKGACIEIDGVYEALNPKFAITNIYRMYCYKMNIPAKRNATVDQIATILEGIYERNKVRDT